MVIMDLLTIHFITLILQPIHQLITLILQPTRTSVSRFIAGHICVLAGGGEDGVASAEGECSSPSPIVLITVLYFSLITIFQALVERFAFLDYANSL